MPYKYFPRLCPSLYDVVCQQKFQAWMAGGEDAVLFDKSLYITETYLLGKLDIFLTKINKGWFGG